MPWTAPRAAGLDLVEISPDAEPPVCKILDFGKFKYQEQKKAAEARKNQKIVEIKEIKMRPGIDDHDYDVKMRAIRRFFEEGDKVKVTLRFRGREMAHQELGMNVLKRVKTDLESHRQGRDRAALRRPPDGHGAGAEVRRCTVPIRFAGPSGPVCVEARNFSRRLAMPFRRFLNVILARGEGPRQPKRALVHRG